MKKFIISLIACSLLATTSCKKFLTTTPTDFIDPATYFTTAAQLQTALNGVYDPLTNSNGLMYFANYCIDLSSTSDLEVPKITATTINSEAYAENSSDVYTLGLWTACYTGIQRANLLLENINTPPKMSDETVRDKIHGEALFLRSYYYFLLCSNFGDVPLLLNSPKSVSNTAVARTPLKQVYDQIIADMTTAEGLLKTQTLAGLGFNGKITVNAADAILARVCLYAAGYPNNDKARYQDALTWSTKLINSGAQTLNPDFTQIFKNLSLDLYDVKEDLWEIEFYVNPSTFATIDGGTIPTFIGPFSQNAVIGNCFGSYLTSLKLFRLYDVDATSTAPSQKDSYDLRRDWSCANFGYNATTGARAIAFTGASSFNVTLADPSTFYPGKYRREYEYISVKGRNYSNINLPVIRYSDVLLMQAEADNEVNNGATAVGVNALNLVRRRGYGILNGNVLKSITITNQGTGYTTVPAISFVGGGGSGATATGTLTSGKLTGISIATRGALTNGTYYTSAPQVQIGNPWVATTAYNIGDQVFNGANLYTVTTAGTSTATPPTQATGASVAATTGAVFTYAGVKAVATATITVGNEADYTGSTSHDTFLAFLQDERARELNYEFLRRNDLIRWNKLVPFMQANAAATRAANGVAKAYMAPADNVAQKHTFFPIPALEIGVNPLLTQNEGY